MLRILNLGSWRKSWTYHTKSCWTTPDILSIDPGLPPLFISRRLIHPAGRNPDQRASYSSRTARRPGCFLFYNFYETAVVFQVHAQNPSRGGLGRFPEPEAPPKEAPKAGDSITAFSKEGQRMPMGPPVNSLGTFQFQRLLDLPGRDPLFSQQLPDPPGSFCSGNLLHTFAP